MIWAVFDRTAIHWTRFASGFSGRDWFVASRFANGDVAAVAKTAALPVCPGSGDKVPRCARKIHACARNHENQAAESQDDGRTRDITC